VRLRRILQAACDQQSRGMLDENARKKGRRTYLARGEYKGSLIYH